MSPISSLARQRKLVLDYAAEHGMSEASRTFGVSRSWLYELKGRYERYGEVGLRPRPRPERRDPRRLPPAVEDAIVSYAITHPTHGPRRIVTLYGMAGSVPRHLAPTSRPLRPWRSPARG